MSVNVVDVADLNVGEGIVNIDKFRRSHAYRDNRTVWVLPSLGMVPIQIVRSWFRVAWPMNTPRAWIDVLSTEVGEAYEQGVELAINRPDCKDFPWVWTYEEDNVQPNNVFNKLFEAMWTCIDCGSPMPHTEKGAPHKDWFCKNGHQGLDGVSGLYFTKSDPAFPMAYGTPGVEPLEFRLRDITDAIDQGAVIEVNGIAQGCSLYRKAIFDKISRPWFRTMNGGENEGNVGALTQDLWFCRKAKEEIKARFAVHTGVIVGHMDVRSGRYF